MTLSLSLSPGLRQELRQDLNLSHKIAYANLMTVPDEVLSIVAGAIVHNPDSIESALQSRKKLPVPERDPASTAQAIYSSLVPSSRADDTIGERGGGGSGLIISPDLKTLEGLLGDYQTVDVTPDVTYIGRKNNKPELVISDHLKIAIGLAMLQIDSSKYPETSKLWASLKRFDEWKRGILRNAYLLIGEKQREFFEDFDYRRLHVYSQEDLSEALELALSTVSRILSNRWFEARNINGDQKFMYTKDLMVTNDDLKRHIILPRLNELLAEEFEKGEAYSDSRLVEEISGVAVARRTIAKYRQIFGIPASSERDRAYREKSIDAPYRAIY